MSFRVEVDVGVLTASTGRDFDRRVDDRLGDVVESVSATLPVLLCKQLFPIFFCHSVLISRMRGLALPFQIAISDCALMAILVRSACGLAIR